MGYSGGIQLDPTYRGIKDHTEALQIEFDPEKVSYEDLVIEWSRMHTPVGTRKCQYRSAVWFLNDDQKETCDEIISGMKALYGSDFNSSAERATRFYRGEEYHQNFTSKQLGGGRW